MLGKTKFWFLKMDNDEVINIDDIIVVGELETSITKWRPNFPNSPTMIVSASRREGKSHLVKFLYLAYFRYTHHFTIVFTNGPTVDDYQFIGEGINRGKVFNSFNGEVLTKAINANISRRRNDEPLLNILVIFDDCISHKSKFSDEILQVFTRGRHSNLSLIFITQTITMTSTIWRDNSDYIILLKSRSPQSRKHIVENLLMGELDLPDNINEKAFYNKMLRNIANNHRALVIDKINVNKSLFWFKAPPDLSIFENDDSDDEDNNFLNDQDIEAIVSEVDTDNDF